MNPKLSIIIPAYNVEHFISKCIESVIDVNMSQEDYEVIIINDGSTDETFSKITEIVGSLDNKNIRFLTQSNQGLSATRNRGMKESRGEYLWFVDSDDSICRESIPFLLSILRKSEFDIIALTTFIEEKKERKIVKRSIPTERIVNGIEIFRKGWVFPYSGAQFYLFNRRLLESGGLLFKDGIFYEDLLFTPQALELGHRCLYINRPVYNYQIRDNSITTTKVTVKHIKSLLYILSNYHCQFKRQDNYIYRAMFCALIKSLYHLFNREIDSATLSQIYDELNSIRVYFVDVLKTCNLKAIYAYLSILRKLSLIKCADYRN